MLFIHGTLRDADMLRAVLGLPLTAAGLRNAIAPGYRVAVHPGWVYPALVPAIGTLRRRDGCSILSAPAISPC